jgi:hypothetical protein
MPIPKKKDPASKLKLGDYVEVLVPLGKDEDGNARYETGIIARGSLSDEAWKKTKADAGDRLLKSVESEKRPASQSVDVEGDSIRFRDAEGRIVIVPRGNTPDREWQKSLLEARKRDTFEGATYNGESFGRQKGVTGSEVGSKLGAEGQQVDPRERPSGGAGLVKQGLQRLVTGQLTPQVGASVQRLEPVPVGMKMLEPVEVPPYQPEMPSTTTGASPASASTLANSVKERLKQGPTVDLTGRQEQLAEIAATAPEATMNMPEMNISGVMDMPEMDLRAATDFPGKPSPSLTDLAGAAGNTLLDKTKAAVGTSDEARFMLGGLPPDATPEQRANFEQWKTSNAYAASPADAMRKLGQQTHGAPPGSQLNQLQSQAIRPGESPAPPAPGQPPSPTGSASMSMSARVPGRSGGGGANLSALDQAAKDAERAMLRGAEAEGAAGRERIAARADMMKRREELAAAEVRAQTRLREEEDRVNNAYMQTLDEISKKREIDPNHFWNTRSDGQKALMVIGSFLAGIGGKDPSAQINQMIQQDIATQRENFEMARQGARDRASGLNTIYGRLRQRGMDEKEAFAASRALMGEQMASQLEDIADRAVDPVAKSKAQLAAANMRMNVEKTKSDITLQAAQTAHLRNQDEMARIKMSASMAAGPKQKEESPGTRSEVAKIDMALSSIDQLLEDVKKTNPARQAIDAQVQLIRGVLPESMSRAFDQLFPDVAQREARAAEVGSTATKAVAGEALSGEERKEARANVPRPGLTQNNTAALVEMKNQLIAKRKSLEGTRFTVGTTSAIPEQVGP